MLGRTLAHYQVQEEIGKGGMGVVYRARDTTLERDVALKVLPENFLEDAERLARFEREAKVLASLNHPGIAAIYGLHHEAGIHFLAMELVPGLDLSQRLARGPLPREEALSAAAQIAAALEYAHDNNVVHRDLKPANIKIQDDHIKILDFGLAKAFLAESDADAASTSALLPTITTGGTRAGVILGTAAYMSPEQARGQTVDRRTDIWAFGCVLYEMLTGKRLFAGDTVSDTIAAVLRADVDLSALSDDVPASVRVLLERCLDRDRNTRLRDIGEARIVLARPDATLALRVMRNTTARPDAPRRLPLPLLLGAAVVVFALGFVLSRLVGGTHEAPRANAPVFEVADPGGKIDTGSVTVSPDGLHLVFTRRRDDGSRVLVRRDLDHLAIRVLQGTDGATLPFWSPESDEIAFFIQRSLHRMSLDGAAPRRVAELPGVPMGGTWNASGVILFGTDDGPIFRINAAGGDIDSVTSVDREWESAHVWPEFLPDGKHFVFLADAGTDEGHRLYVQALDGSDSRILRKGLRSAIKVDPAGYLLINEDRQLLALPFDFKRREMVGSPRLVQDGIQSVGDHHMPTFSISRNGVLACRVGSDAGSLVRLSLEGRVLQTIGTQDRYRNPALSPDGRLVAYELLREQQTIWVEDIERGVKTPVSDLALRSDSATWSHDGRYLYFGSDMGKDVWSVNRKLVSGGSHAVKLNNPASGSYLNVLDCSADGVWLLVSQGHSGGGQDLYLGALQADSIAWHAWTDTPDVGEPFGRFSPDSRWIAFQSNVSGSDEIYVASVEDGPGVNRYIISQQGGTDPGWSPDGTRVYYRNLSETLMAVPVSYTPDGLDVGLEQPLFELATPPATYVRNAYDPFPDGQSLLGWVPANSSSSVIQVNTHWR